jgi:hypothetical protein
MPADPTCQPPLKHIQTNLLLSHVSIRVGLQTIHYVLVYTLHYAKGIRRYGTNILVYMLNDRYIVGIVLMLW